MATKRVRRERLADHAIELPRIDYGRRNGRPYRFAYGASAVAESSFLDRLVKIDVEDGSTALWREDGTYPGEPVFVARPDGAGEDDGVALSVVLDPEHGRSFLLVLDAASFAERARAEVPHHIPFGFHGQYFGSLN
jgi:carotenoid cleavage dioxygenase-like enzyme